MRLEEEEEAETTQETRFLGRDGMEEGEGGEGRGREGKRERQKGGRKDCVLHDVDHLVACSALSYDNQKCFQTAKSLSWVVKISPC